MRALNAIRDSRKYFLTFVMLISVTYFYLRLDHSAVEYADKQKNFEAWGWLVVVMAGGYLGANALQHSLSSPNSNGPDIVINNRKQQIPEK
jgi:hypothetical protein